MRTKYDYIINFILLVYFIFGYYLSINTGITTDEIENLYSWSLNLSAIKDFSPSHQLDSLELIEAFLWDKDTWQKKTEGTAIRRISHEQWLRNVAIALGNAKKSNRLMIALESRRDSDSIIVKEHVEWAIQQHSQ